MPAHPPAPGRTPALTRRSRPEEHPAPKPPPAFAVDLDLGFAVQKDVKRVALTILARERFSGRHTDLVTLFPDELQLPLREAGEARDPPPRLCRGGCPHPARRILFALRARA